jgi:hypothetical protein
MPWEANRNRKTESGTMNETDWQHIPCRLKEAGFDVFYERISYDPGNPLWRAHANGNGREWSSMGRDLETALVELEKQTQGPVSNWREIRPLERANATAARHPGGN